MRRAMLLLLGIPGCLLADYDKVDLSATATEAAPETCCTALPGSSCEDTAVAACVCAVDDYCCTTEWDDTCATQVAAFGCGACGAEAPRPPPEPIECDADADCGAGAPMCVHGQCAQCGADADCEALDPAYPLCGAEGFCGECTTSAQCEAAHGNEAPICHLGLCVADL